MKSGVCSLEDPKRPVDVHVGFSIKYYIFGIFLRVHDMTDLPLFMPSPTRVLMRVSSPLKKKK